MGVSGFFFLVLTHLSILSVRNMASFCLAAYFSNEMPQENETNIQHFFFARIIDLIRNQSRLYYFHFELNEI